MANNNGKIKLLLVDDEPLIRESLYEILRMEGYSVQTAETGEAALELMQAIPADILVTDFKLPKMSRNTPIHDNGRHTLKQRSNNKH